MQGMRFASSKGRNSRRLITFQQSRKWSKFITNYEGVFPSFDRRILLSVRTLDRFQGSTADYAAHRLAIGENELSALVADLGLNLKARILTG